MAWIESHQTLREHPKTYLLCGFLSIEKSQVIGHLHLLWWWCVDYAPAGQIKHNDQQIARAAEWSGDSKQFVDALIAAGFLDRGNGVLTVHDWLDFCGALMEKRLQRIKSNKKRLPKKSVRLPKDELREPTNPTNPTNPTQPDPTNQNIAEQVKALLDSFGNALIKNKAELYLSRVAQKNKSGVISDGRKLTLLTELFNSRQRADDDNAFGYALDQAIGRDACNVGYINAIIKNKKTQKPSEYREYYAPAKLS